MKETLASLFKPYRPITPIVAHRNTRMRGQAFVSFHDKASAEKARSDVNEFPLYGKPIVSSSVLFGTGWERRGGTSSDGNYLVLFHHTAPTR